MRRADKQIGDPAAVRNVLEEARVLHLALLDGGEPYLVPVIFAAEAGRLYFHSARGGRKMNVLKDGVRVCFEAETGVEVLQGAAPCKWSLRYRSVVGWGRVSIVEDAGERVRVLDLLMDKYARAAGVSSPTEGGKPYSEAALRATAVLRIDIERMTGKVSPAASS